MFVKSLGSRKFSVEIMNVQWGCRQLKENQASVSDSADTHNKNLKNCDNSLGNRFTDSVMTEARRNLYGNTLAKMNSQLRATASSNSEKVTLTGQSLGSQPSDSIGMLLKKLDSVVVEIKMSILVSPVGLINWNLNLKGK